MKTDFPMQQNSLSRVIRPILVFAASATLWAVSGTASAASIGVNFGNNLNGTLAATDSAGAAPFAQTHYNNLTSAPTNVVLNDDSGAVTTATVTTANALFSRFNSPPSGPDELLNSEIADTLDTNISITINNIPYASYSLIVYDLATSGTVQGITVGGTTFFSSAPTHNGTGFIDNNAATPFTYTLATSTNSAAPTPLSDYVIFPGLTGASQTVNDNYVSGSDFLVIGGFQIVQTAAVPEPATWALLLGGLGLLGGVQRFRRQSKG
jgi:hypothetical protein